MARFTFRVEVPGKADLASAVFDIDDSLLEPLSQKEERKLINHHLFAWSKQVTKTTYSQHDYQVEYDGEPDFRVNKVDHVPTKSYFDSNCQGGSQ